MSRKIFQLKGLEQFCRKSLDVSQQQRAAAAAAMDGEKNVMVNIDCQLDRI